MEKEYPSLDDVREDYKTLRALSPAYAGRKGELTAVLQYVYQSILLERLGKADMSKTVLGIAIAEMHHLELLGSAIVRLGALPAFTACPPYPVCYFSASCVNYTKSPIEMIEADIQAEREAISDYRKIISCITNEPITALLLRIIEDEEAHLAAFERMKKELKNG